MHKPEVHLQAAYRILHYLKGTSRKEIMFKRKNGLLIEAYTDTDYVGLLVDWRSISRYCTFL